METIRYRVARIQGDYAVLVPEGDPEAPENPVALALLPDGVGEGSRLLWQDLEYTLLP